MKKKIYPVLAIFILFALSEVQGAEVEKKEVITKTLKFSNPRGSKELEVDNMNGSINVVGQNRDDVEIVVHKTIVAESEEKINEADSVEVLDITEKNNFISLYVDAPYRKHDGSVNYRGWKHYRYKVSFSYQISVPFETDLVLKTINDGDIVVTGVRGNFEVNNINGAVTMKAISGSGKAYSLNKDTRIEFEKNPSEGCYFGSLNGDVIVAFRSGLSADFKIKTFNGDAFTDFSMTYLPLATSVQQKENGKFVYKAERATSLRTGNGGPLIELDGFNGDIQILER
ncbi:MAG: hypothetical protein ACOY90_14765 [Candidatus Zhuqueibacterota bacterium]